MGLGVAASAREVLQLREHGRLGWESLLHGQGLGHELEGGWRGTGRVLVGQGVEGLQCWWWGQVGRHLGERGSRGEVRWLLLVRWWDGCGWGWFDLGPGGEGEGLGEGGFPGKVRRGSLGVGALGGSTMEGQGLGGRQRARRRKRTLEYRSWRMEGLSQQRRDG